jgi:hypothetical protein
MVEKRAAIFEPGKIAEAEADQVKGVTLGVVDGEASGGKQGVIEELGSGASATEDEDWRLGARAASRC